ncbi:MAG TPA: RNA polymerase sigma-70 factor [Porphyromonadaceae bacterium]|uniref:RNA polymerase sigma-70 factor n=1 Tax=Limibacterium fermenti TaxID=3229863 RepID=UPI000E98DE28|nr:RNA polymerase sigma-70 factor [Porphyromonadaceae bacterium]HBK30302.1 RNA polymerase sigma-70 factor [Porphyromonadaceae bacterium]HBL34833.1 RNA polymerase sigma-70 factor [Porphyromonadaceae bacterium]HBX20908.1 RNA polymerase sigma-70 factor [Porphyromonadaceae bacterium]HBX46378.1 RNA polymerase sigma-70 factor [Porphyromonadaceae bacterium]
MDNELDYKIEFEKVYCSYYSRMKRFAQEYVLHEEDAENIVQDVFLELWEHKEVLSTYVYSSGFLFTSVKNRCIDFLRRKTRSLKISSELQEEYAYTLQMKLQSLEAFEEELFSKPDIEAIITNAVNNLPDKCREIFIMNKFQGKKQRIIAEELDISIHTVESQMAIAYKKLKEDLKDLAPLFLFLFSI